MASTTTPTHSSVSADLRPLLQRHQTLADQQRSPFTLRMHRALSWLQRADAAGADDDVAFVCLWIAFNAAYAQDMGDGMASERLTFRNFVGDVCRLDKDKALAALVWQVFPGPVRLAQPCTVTGEQGRPRDHQAGVPERRQRLLHLALGAVVEDA